MKTINDDKQLKNVVSKTLKIGVWSAISFSFVGMVGYLCQHGFDTNDFHTLSKTPTPFDLKKITSSSSIFSFESLMLLGVLILILTPILRVILSIIGFYKEKDHLYVLISSVVLAIIIISFLIGGTH